MISKLCFNPSALLPASRPNLRVDWGLPAAGALAVWLGVCCPTPAKPGDAPAWMHAAAAAPLPPHDEKTDAVTIYSEDVTMVQSEGKVSTRRGFCGTP